MVQLASLDIDASWFVMTSKVKGHGDIGHFGHFSHFGRQIWPLCLRNRAKNLWNTKTRAQELTSGANRMFLSLFIWIWELFKDEMVICKNSQNCLWNRHFTYTIWSLKSSQIQTSKDKNMWFASLVSSWALVLKFHGILVRFLGQSGEILRPKWLKWPKWPILPWPLTF